MKKVRGFINVALGSFIAALGLSSCDRQVCLYGPNPNTYVDTTAHCMYGVDPNPMVDWDEENK